MQPQTIYFNLHRYNKNFTAGGSPQFYNAEEGITMKREDVFNDIFTNPVSGEWRDISCPNYKSFLHDVGIERDLISEHILPTI